MKKLFALNLSKKILLMVLTIITIFCIALFSLYQGVKKESFKERQLKVQHQTETAWTVLDYYAGLEKSGQLNRNDAQKQAKEAVKKLRYGDSGYFWINDMQPRMIMHPIKPALDGKDLSASQDPDGKRLFVEFANVCRKQGSGFVNYLWPKPGFNDPVEKISYVKRLAAWDWVIGTGLYVDDVEAALSSIRAKILTVILVVIVITLLLTWLVNRSIITPLTEIKLALNRLAEGKTTIEIDSGRPGEAPLNHMQELGATLKILAAKMRRRAQIVRQIANGDLTIEIPVASNDDELGIAITQIHSQLKNILCRLFQTAEQIENGSENISGSSQALSDGSTQQAAALEEINSSVTQMADQTRQNAENANQANTLANKAKDSAEKGNQQMTALVQAMAEINESGQNISKIIKVIDEIAFQTNLLALNAAVEAARAGQHGKGFAVVAEEVRNLAARSAKAAQETSALIEGSVAKAGNGANLADSTAEALAEIVTDVAKATDLIGEIAIASNEQAQSTDQINIGLTQIDNIGQKNTASAEETAATAEELANQAGHLNQLLNMFTLDQADCNRPSMTTSRPAPVTLQNRPGAGPAAKPQAPSPAAAPTGNSAWGGIEKSTGNAPRIALDDDDFGKY